MIKKTPCIFVAFEDVGSGRSLEVYYQAIRPSSIIQPIMAYTSDFSYMNAPKWIKNKILMSIPPVDHDLGDCKVVGCSRLPNQHRNYQAWNAECTQYIMLLRKKFGEKSLWVLDMTLPELEPTMGRTIIQVFHGELFDIGSSYFQPPRDQSFHRYSLIFVHGLLLRDRIAKKCGLSINDRRFRLIGRVLNDSLYNKNQFFKEQVLLEYGLNTQNKTVLYAPTWESKRLFAIGKKRRDTSNMRRFLSFFQKNDLNIIVRPHTITLQHTNLKKTYLDLVTRYKNAYFDDSTHYDIHGQNRSLIAADILITDLSSIAIDFASLNKPAIFLYPNPKDAIKIWGKNFPSFSKVQSLSYAVRSFSKLFRLINTLVTTPEPQEQIIRRKRFVQYALAVTDGSSGDLFRMALEEYVKNQQFIRFFTLDYVKNALRYVKRSINLMPNKSETCISGGMHSSRVAKNKLAI